MSRPGGAVGSTSRAAWTALPLAGPFFHGLLLPGTGERHHRRGVVRPDRDRLLDGVRGAEAAQLRARGSVYGWRVRRVLRDPVVRWLYRADDPGTAAAGDHVRAGRTGDW